MSPHCLGLSPHVSAVPKRTMENPITKSLTPTTNDAEGYRFPPLLPGKLSTILQLENKELETCGGGQELAALTWSLTKELRPWGSVTLLTALLKGAQIPRGWVRYKNLNRIKYHVYGYLETIQGKGQCPCPLDMVLQSEESALCGLGADIYD